MATKFWCAPYRRYSNWHWSDNERHYNKNPFKTSATIHTTEQRRARIWIFPLRKRLAQLGAGQLARHRRRDMPSGTIDEPAWSISTQHHKCRQMAILVAQRSATWKQRAHCIDNMQLHLKAAFREQQCRNREETYGYQVGKEEVG